MWLVRYLSAQAGIIRALIFLIFLIICATQASIGWHVGSCLTNVSVLARIASADSGEVEELAEF